MSAWEAALRYCYVLCDDLPAAFVRAALIPPREDVISLTKDTMAFDHYDMVQKLWAVLDVHKIKY